MFYIKRRESCFDHKTLGDGKGKFVKIELVMPNHFYAYLRRHADDRLATIQVLISVYRDFESKFVLWEIVRFVNFFAGRPLDDLESRWHVGKYETTAYTEDDADHHIRVVLMYSN